jgi:hypothetical protein
MTLRKTVIAVSVVGVSILPGVATAHHSFAMFDADHTKEIQGTVRDYQWTQPHVWLDVMVQNKSGKLERWGLENQSPAILFRHRWTKESIKEGDKVTVLLHPMKDGTLGGQLLRVTFPDGRVLANQFAVQKKADSYIQ